MTFPSILMARHPLNPLYHHGLTVNVVKSLSLASVGMIVTVFRVEKQDAIDVLFGRPRGMLMTNNTVMTQN